MKPCMLCGLPTGREWTPPHAPGRSVALCIACRKQISATSNACGIILPNNYDGLIGVNDRNKCAMCFKEAEGLIYRCKCSEHCCIRLCMNCRNSRMHTHNKIGHFIKHYDVEGDGRGPPERVE
ncbi:MAG: hypothetical protein OXK17_05570 [Thaumarchaeota archaeon]|nr:hypothetical protein [Nitrososphaerota archaeon]